VTFETDHIRELRRVTLAPRQSLPAAARRVRRATPSEQRLCRIIGHLVAAAFGVSVRALQAPQRGPAPVAFARQVAMYLGHVVFRLNLTAVGRAFHRDRATARHACRLVEDCRDDAMLDRLLTLIERCCICAAQADMAVRS
jgi:chromosomal replication initiation ATPase DnaA